MPYNTIPDDLLDKIEVRWPHMKTAIANLRAAGSPMLARQIEKAIANNVLSGATPIPAIDLWALTALTEGKPFGAHLSDGVRRRVMALREQRLSYAGIADRLAAEGYGNITRGRVAQIVKG
jgi:hypothetical protein